MQWVRRHFRGFEVFIRQKQIKNLSEVTPLRYAKLIGACERIVCPQTFSHTVMCKVCLTASNTLFDADAFVRLNH